MKPRPHHKPRPRLSRPAGNPAPESLNANITHWANVADWYDELVGAAGTEYHQHVVLPGVQRMLQLDQQQGSLADLRVLDLACGQGVLCRSLAQQGIHVTGIDAAAPLIEAAQRRNDVDQFPIRYLTADATRLYPLPSPLDAESFDAVTCVLAIQNITPLSPVWQACHLLLKPAGRLILIMMHPCFRIPKQSHWAWDDATGTQYRRVDQYLTSNKVEIDMHPGRTAAGEAGEKTFTFHRPLQAYINTLGSAGLLIDHVEEWVSHKKSQAGPKAAALDRSRREIPMFLAIRARKI